ncbi:hypothetical protein Enr13x_44960 [Stieleria neptunia]|uniref:Uncharacterized protein n=1 Tax=Stieleria neptunia TaxID=2527979 RepID=A0A518HUT5_9BACT|nr:hypothetical protein Enr13x_44960 [Stieleria neptunia]
MDCRSNYTADEEQTEEYEYTSYAATITLEIANRPRG